MNKKNLYLYNIREHIQAFGGFYKDIIICLYVDTFIICGL